jgi:hypothetical protein
VAGGSAGLSFWNVYELTAEIAMGVILPGLVF